MIDHRQLLSINVRFQRDICRAPLQGHVQECQQQSVISTIEKYTLESFSECTGVSDVVNVRWKSVPGSWTGVEEAMFSKSSSISGRYRLRSTAAEPVDLSLYLPLDAETVDTQPDRYFAASPMWMWCISYMTAVTIVPRPFNSHSKLSRLESTDKRTIQYTSRHQTKFTCFCTSASLNAISLIKLTVIFGFTSLYWTVN